MQLQQPLGTVKIKIPVSVKSKLKKSPQDSLQIQNFFSNNSKERNLSGKQEQLKAPPTPNLQFLKQNKMRQHAQQSNQYHGQFNNKLNVQKSLNDFEQLQDQFSTNQRFVCPSHPNKRAKYVLASNTNIKLCTKCAVTMAQRQPVLDEEKFHKITEIDRFRQTIKIVKNVISERQQDSNQGLLQQKFEKMVSDINKQFQILHQLLAEKKQNFLNLLEKKYQEILHAQAKYNQTLSNTLINMDKYLYDVNRNYQDIIQDLSISHFNDIMQQYHAKINHFVKNISSPIDVTIQSDEYIKKTLIQIRAYINNVPVERKMSENRKQNMNVLNLKHKYSRTPDRLAK